MIVLLFALTLLVSFMGHPYLIGSLELSQGLQGGRVSCRMVIITINIIVIALPLLTYWQYPNFMHDQDIGLLWLKKRCFCFLIIETATLKGFYRKHLAMLSNIQCCHFQSPHPRDSHQKDWDGKISWSMAAGVTKILSTVVKVIFILFLKITCILRLLLDTCDFVWCACIALYP